MSFCVALCEVRSTAKRPFQPAVAEPVNWPRWNALARCT